jgi:uncharacterized protein YjbI with pentapeptide repeats
LIRTSLHEARLTGATLTRADLGGADLSETDLSGTNLSGADLIETDLSDADLHDARGVTEEQLEETAKTLQGATMPNGQTYEDWLKSKGRRGDGENSGSS